MPKLKIGLYWAAACGGCDVSVLDLHEKILKVAEAADILFWPIALDFKEKDVEAMPDGHMDVCFFNGAVRNSENEHMAKLLRKKSKVLVAFGSCSYLGGVPGLANFYQREDVLRTVYCGSPSTPNEKKTIPQEKTTEKVGELKIPAFYAQVKTLAQVVPVEYFLPGCPPAVEQVWAAVEAIVTGKLPKPPAVVGASDKALCDECPRKKGEKKIKQFRSVADTIPDPEICLLEQGIICCGPATRAGCGYRCIKANMPCRGCYGPTPGVIDQGAKMLSAVASVIDSSDPDEVEKIVAGIPDPAGTFYRFSLPDSLLRGVRVEEAK